MPVAPLCPFTMKNLTGLSRVHVKDFSCSVSLPDEKYMTFAPGVLFCNGFLKGTTAKCVATSDWCTDHFP